MRVVGSIALWLGLLVAGRLLRARGIPPPRTVPVLVAASAGVWSHLLLDATNSYGIRPFLPWDGRWFYGDFWHIVDPWLWLVLGTAVFLSGSHGRRRAARWIAAAVAVTVLIVVAPIPGVEPGMRVAWVLALALAMIVARRMRDEHAPTSAPRIGLGLVLAYAVACASLHTVALARVDAAAAPGTTRRAALPRFGDPLRWDGLFGDLDTVQFRKLGVLPALDPPSGASRRFARNFDDPRAREVLDSCAGAVLLDFFRFPFARVESRPAGDGRVVIRDARYSRESDGFASFSVPLRAGAPDLTAVSCP